MQLRQYSHALATALPLFTSLAVGELAPWHVTGLGTYSPSGRPGNSPDYYIHVNISNPDPTQSDPAPSTPPGNVYCQAIWVYPDVPYNKIVECDIVDSTTPTTWVWTLEPLEAGDESPWPTTNFDLRWRAASTSAYPTEEGIQIWTGVGQFEVGKNMKGLCAASGFCVWELKPESNPVLIDVSSVSCQGTLEEALHGINCG
ncbi:hypothetical protein HD806DRAFT_502121 [Xylariaceae sp. AK1471]|nr:hypothetical protein HD806DRAFT_502121 [Xylariaceae sp. AK1471]